MTGSRCTAKFGLFSKQKIEGAAGGGAAPISYFLCAIFYFLGSPPWTKLGPSSWLNSNNFSRRDGRYMKLLFILSPNLGGN